MQAYYAHGFGYKKTMPIKPLVGSCEHGLAWICIIYRMVAIMGIREASTAFSAKKL